MCGIAGLVGVERREARRRVDAALDRLRHRGPDGAGVDERDDAVIGMRRLAIIDLAGGDQPIYNEDRSVVVVCNGELYNYVEGFAELEARGHRLQSRSDVNLLPHLYEERGRDAVEACRGMFAAAIWDAAAHRLVLARDRAGKKPLFYAAVRQGLAFASELPALLAMLDRAPSLSDTAIADYLRLGFVPHPQTIYAGVHALPPGCTAVFAPGGEVDVRPYWTPTGDAPFAGSRADALEQLDARLAEAVRIRLRSDVPIGLFLSGGIDSGLVAAYAAAAGARDLLAFTVEVPDAELNEAPAAALVAERFGLPLERIAIDYSPRQALEEVPLLYGQPFGDSSAVPSYFVSRAARRSRKVVLNGDGGDEVFAGYRRYWLGRVVPWGAGIARAAAPAIAAAGRGLAGRGARRSAAGFAARALRGLAQRPDDRYLTWTADLFADADVARVFPALAAQGPTLARLAGMRGEGVSTSTVRAFQRSDYRLILADDLLPKMDIATMANSVEARSPFLDTALLEFAWSLPDAWLISARETKPLLRELARRQLPPEVARAPKRGFEVPVARWLREDLREAVGDVLLAPDARLLRWADRRRLHDFVAARDGFVGNRAQAVWALLVLELFLRAPTPAPAS